jgi:hypothetical protein
MQPPDGVFIPRDPGVAFALDLSQLPPGVWSVWEAPKPGAASEGQTWLRFSWSPTPSRGPIAPPPSLPES